jgi:hypothetical protein
MTLLPALRLLNIRLELQSMPLTQAVRISHFVCTYPCNINKSETALSEIYMYYDKTVPSTTIDTLKSYRFVTMINMTNNSITNKMSWRFLVASDPNIERYVIRDIDSRLSRREKNSS